MKKNNDVDEDNNYFNGIEDEYSKSPTEVDKMTHSFQWDTFSYTTSGSLATPDIQTIMNRLGSGLYTVPGFQRKFVWEKSQVAGLALSILKGIPVPPIYVYIDEKDGSEVILDGQQRLTALFLYYHSLFFSDRYTRKKLDFSDIHKKMERIKEIDSKIKNSDDSLKNEYKDLCAQLKNKYGLSQTKYEVKRDKSDKSDKSDGGKYDITFANLDGKLKRSIERRMLQFAIVQCSKGDEPEKFYTMVFNNLNTGGKNLGPQEIRNGLYWKTNLYRSLFLVNESNTIWRQIYGNISLYSKDVELLLKMMALDYYTEYNDEENVIINYKGTFNWSNIMMEFSEKAKTWKKEEVDDKVSYIESFLSSIEVDSNGKRCKKAALEAVYVAVNKLHYISKGHDNPKIKMSWLICLSENNDIFGEGKVLSNKESVQQRLTKTLPIVRKEYGKYCENSKTVC